MKWNVDDIAFLYRPDVFTGSFDNSKMQARHELEVQRKLQQLMESIDQETDPFLALKKLHTKDHMQFLHNNLEQFQIAGKLEEAVLFLYSKLNAPFSSGGDAAVWNSLFEKCDRAELYKLGSPVSLSSATVYRGSVTGFKRSLSWTPDRKMAEKYSERWKDPSLGGGEVYEIDIKRDNILASLKRQHGEEILLAPGFIKSAVIRDFNAG